MIRPLQRGMVLVSSLLLLVVVTILAIGMFRTFGLDEKIAGNTRDKQRAVQAAVSAQQYAEWWLSTGADVSNTNCTGLVNAQTAVQVCLNPLPTAVTNVAIVPWTIGGQPVGVAYTPPGMNVQTGANITAGTYYQSPVFYISYLGVGVSANGAQGNIYQIDSVGYGGSPGTTAVVESTYILQTSDIPLG